MSNWETVRLGDVCDYENSRVSIAMFDDDNYISTENMQPNKGGVCRASSLPSVSAATKFLKGQTLVSNIRPYFKKIWFADKDGGCSNDVLCFRLNKDINNKYFYYLLSQDSFFDYVMSGSKGTKMPRGDRGQIMQFEFMLPSLEEQRRIAGILGALDDKIECNNRINRNLEEQATALFRRWFVDFEFPDPDPTSPTYGKPYRSAGGTMQDSPRGSIPEGWQVKQMNEVSNINAGGDKPKVCSKTPIENCDIPIYSNGIDNFGLYGYTDTAKIVEESITISARGTIGFVCLRQNPYLPIVRLISIIPNKEMLSVKYLYLWANNQNISGTGTTQLQLTVPDFRKTEIIIPTDNIMQKFTSVANSLFEIIEANRTENQTLATLRDTLLPKLMSNQIKM